MCLSCLSSSTAYEVLSDSEVSSVELAKRWGLSSIAQKRSIYDRHGEVRQLYYNFALYLIYPQEGLKAHEGGGGHANPFDVFSSFFGGGRKYPYRACKCSGSHTVDRGTGVRKGPTMVSEFEVPLADM